MGRNLFISPGGGGGVRALGLPGATSGGFPRRRCGSAQREALHTLPRGLLLLEVHPFAYRLSGCTKVAPSPTLVCLLNPFVRLCEAKLGHLEFEL